MNILYQTITSDKENHGLFKRRKTTQKQLLEDSLDLLPSWGTIKKSPSALQKAQLSIDLLAVYLYASKILFLSKVQLFPVLIVIDL